MNLCSLNSTEHDSDGWPIDFDPSNNEIEIEI